MTSEATAADVARALADALERHHLPYALGGALALAYYAPPRATVDVDMNVFVAPEHGLDRVLSALKEAGFTTSADLQTVQKQAEAEAQFRGSIGEFRVDVFLPAIPYYAELEVRRRQVELAGRPIWILAPEDLTVLKLLFYRRKDLADVEAMLRDQKHALDLDFVRRTLTDLVGAADERLTALDQIERDVEEE